MSIVWPWVPVAFLQIVPPHWGGSWVARVLAARPWESLYPALPYSGIADWAEACVGTHNIEPGVARAFARAIMVRLALCQCPMLCYQCELLGGYL